MEKTTNIRRRNNQNEEPITLKDLMAISMEHWGWFVVSLIVCLTFATWYGLKSIPVFKQSATIMIKDEDKGGSASRDISRTFQSMGLVQSNTNVQNELISIQSPDVMLEVVNRMNLDVVYTVDGMFHKNTLYGETLPVKVSFANISDQSSASFDLLLKSDGTFTLSKFAMDKDKYEEEVNGKLQQTVNTPIGKLKVERSIFYKAPKKDMLIHITRVDLYNAATAVQKSFDASLTHKDATTIDLNYLDVSKRRAADIINCIVAVYNENWVKDKNQIAISTSKFINERLEVIERELGNVDSDISSYKSKELIPDVVAAGSMAMNVARDADKSSVELTNQLYMAQYIRNYVGNDANKNQVLPANTGLQGSGVDNLIREYNDKLLMRNNLVANSSEKNPIVVDLDAALRGIRSAIISSLDNQVVTLREQLRQQQGVVGKATSQMASSPKQAKYLLSVERQQKVKENLYIFLLQKREENEMNMAFTAYNTRIIATPHGPKQPISPVKLKIYLFAILLGFIIPLAIIYIRESLNTKVRGKKDLDDVLTIPYLGEIPQITTNSGRKKNAGKELSVKTDSRNVLNEAFRVLRTNIDFMMGSEKDEKVIILTSYNPGSGKSFIAVNLSASIAMTGKRVLVIDCDMRHRSLSEYIGGPETGLSNYLSGKVKDYHECIMEYPGRKNLYMLPVGTMPPNPTELLLSPRFAELMQSIREEYDYILIDCPPIDIIADTSIVEKLSDKTLFVMRAGIFERSMLKQLEGDYQNKKFKSLSIVLNGTESSGGRYGYRYGYGYGYRYGDRYGEKSKVSLWTKIKRSF